MATILGSLLLKITGDTADATQAIDKVEKKAKGFSKFIKGAAGIGGAVIAFRALKNIAGDLIRQYSAQETAEAKLAAAIKATGGAAGITKGEMFDLAKELSRVTTYADEALIEAEGVMLTFTKIGQETFPEAIEAAADMSAMFGQDLQQSVIQLGTALNDPIAGVGRLKRISISFSETQQEMIRNFVEQGDIMGAQNVILSEMKAEFGGVAREMGTTATGSLARLNNAMGDLKEMAGGVLLEGLQPLIVGLTNFATRTLEAWSAKRKLNKAMKGEATTLEDATLAFKTQEEEVANLNAQLVAQRGIKERVGKLDSRAANMSQQIIDSKLKEIAAAEELLPLLEAQVEKLGKQETILPPVIQLNDLLADSTDELAVATDRAEKGRAAYNETSIVSRLTDEDLWIANQAAADAIDIVTAAQYNLSASFAAMSMNGRAWSDFLATTMVAAYGDAFMAIGQALVDAEDGWEAFKDAAKNAVAAVLEMLGKQFAVHAMGGLVPLPGLFNPMGAGAAFAASAAAFIAAGVVRSLHEGGDFIVPPGYPNDSYPIAVESGERVQVTRKEEVGRSAGGPTSGDVYLDGAKVGRWFEQQTKNRQIMIDAGAVK